MKKCNKCSEEKALSEFSKDKSIKSGYVGICKSCIKTYNKNYRSKPENKAKKREYDSKVNRQTEDYKARRKLLRSTPKYREWARSYEARQNVKERRALYYSIDANKNKPPARKAVARALKKGTLIKKPCEHCGEIKVEAHHWSYKEENWLDVIWLCRQCHATEHVRIRANG